MNIQTISFANKQAMGTQPTIPEANKITDSNVNEIKSVVNNNASSLTDLSKYDTTETVVGTWIDGKPIYRRVYNQSGSMTTSSWVNFTSISNVDTLTFGLFGGSANNCVWNDVLVRVNNNYIQYYTTLSHSYTWCVIEYTKTTD